jgi:serine/threonine-protein kinase RsbW
MSSDSESTFDFLADKLLFKLQVTLAADKAAVDAVVQRIMASIRAKDCAAGKEQEIELALSEALANAVVHGAKSDTSKVVECDVACDANRSLLIVVRDPGDGFDPAAIPSPVIGQNIYSGHGRGSLSLWMR